MATDEPWSRTARAHEALYTAGGPVARPSMRDLTQSRPGGAVPETEVDRSYAFIRACAGKRLTGPRVDAMVAVWDVIRDGATGAPSHEASAVSSATGLAGALPHTPPARRESLARAVTESCVRLAEAPGAVSDVIAHLHALWLRILGEETGCTSLTEEDCRALGRVAGVLNPSMGGLPAHFLPGCDVDRIERDRVDVLVANIANICYFMLDSEPSVRRVVQQYFMGCAVTGMSDPARAEVARYGQALEAAARRTVYEHLEHVDPAHYRHSLDRIMGESLPGTGVSPGIRTWITAVHEAVTHLPTDFRGNQAGSAVKIMLTVRNAVQELQAEPVWGDDNNWGVAIPFVAAITGYGLPLGKAHALAAWFAYFVSIEKARDEVKGDWETARPIPLPEASTWTALTAGWPEPFKRQMNRLFDEAGRIRGSTACRDRTPAQPTLEDSAYTPGEEFHEYLWDRAHDGFWPISETCASAESGGPLHVLEVPDFWLDAEASMYAFELYHARRRKFEDAGRSLLSHVNGPSDNRITWAFRRILDLQRDLDHRLEAGTSQISGANFEGGIWYWALCLPGTPTWDNCRPGTAGS
ncbi:hypothetical protein ACPCTO_36690 [Streptomyces olivoreticuli]